MRVDWDPVTRTEEVQGAPERLLPPDEIALDARHLQAMETLRVVYGYPEEMPLAPFFATLANSPEFFAGFMGLGVAATISSALPDRLRELAILRTGWLCGAPYQWGEHVHSTRALFSSEEIARVREGSQADGWSEAERAVLRAAEDLRAQAMISDETWAMLARHLNPQQLIELPLVVGHYTMTAYLQNSLRTPLNPHNPGLTAG